MVAGILCDRLLAIFRIELLGKRFDNILFFFVAHVLDGFSYFGDLLGGHFGHVRLSSFLQASKVR